MTSSTGSRLSRNPDDPGVRSSYGQRDGIRRRLDEDIQILPSWDQRRPGRAGCTVCPDRSGATVLPARSRSHWSRACNSAACRKAASNRAKVPRRAIDSRRPLAAPEAAGWVSRVVSEHVAGEGGPHAELVEEHHEDVLQALGRDAEPFRQVPTLGSHVFVEAMVSDPRQAEVQERGTIPRSDGDLVEKRCFLPGLNPFQGLVRNPLRMLRDVRIVAVSDGFLAQQFDGSLERQGRLRFEDLHDPSSHPIVAAGELDETGLVSRILAAITEDQQPFLSVMVRPRLVELGKDLDESLAKHLDRGRRPEADRSDDVVASTRFPAADATCSGRQKGHLERIATRVAAEFLAPWVE